MPDPKQDPSSSSGGWEEPAESQRPTVAEPPRTASGAYRRPLPGLPPDQNSLALLAKDLIPPPPAPPQVTLPEVQAVTDRKVQYPGLWITVKSWARRWAVSSTRAAVPSTKA